MGWAVLGAITVIGLVFFSLSEDNPETLSITAEDPTQKIVTSTTFQVESKMSQVNSNSFQGNIENISINNENKPISLIQKADAVTETEETLDVILYELNGDQSAAIDSSKNMFSGANNKVSRLDFATNTLTTWTLPNDQHLSSEFADVDSSGFYYFGMRNNFANENKLAKLDHTTNIFTEWVIPVSVVRVSIDSSDNIYILSNSQLDPESNERVFLRKLDTNTNTLTKYILPAGVSPFPGPIHFTMNDSGIFHFISTSNSDIFKFDINTDSITLWENPSVASLSGIGANSMGKIYFGERFQFRNQIAELDPSTNILKEWLIPFSGTPRIIAVDDEGKVFYGEKFTRFIPSTNTFTQWELEAEVTLETLSDGTILIVESTDFQLVSSPIPPAP